MYSSRARAPRRSILATGRFAGLTGAPATLSGAIEQTLMAESVRRCSSLTLRVEPHEPLAVGVMCSLVRVGGLQTRNTCGTE